MATLRHATAWLTLTVVTLWATGASAEQFQRFGRYEAHYIVVNTTFLKPDVAARLGLKRAANTALVNISVLDSGPEPAADTNTERGAATPVPASVSGSARNLLGTARPLRFTEIREGPAIYYIATLRFTEEEHWRFAIDLGFPDGSSAELTFQQQLYLR